MLNWENFCQNLEILNLAFSNKVSNWKFLNIIFKNAANLKSLNLSHSLMSEYNTNGVNFELINENLEELTIPANSFTKFEFLASIISHCQKLKKIDLSQSKLKDENII